MAVRKERGLLLVYGPFKYNGEFTTDSNAHFDLWLKARDPVSGVRDFEWVNELAESAGLKLLEDNDMPANNQMLVWIIRLAPPGRYARFLDPGWSNPDIFPQRPGEPAS